MLSLFKHLSGKSGQNYIYRGPVSPGLRTSSFRHLSKPPTAALPLPERNTSSEAPMYLSRMLTFRADEDMAAELARIPDRSEFMRRAIEKALERRPAIEAAEPKEVSSP